MILLIINHQTVLMDYALPYSDVLPDRDLDRTVSPSPVNPLGVNGESEMGTIASTPAVVNTVMDELNPFGIKDLDIPLTPPKVWQALNNGG